jgi:hypothetical protein
VATSTLDSPDRFDRINPATDTLRALRRTSSGHKEKIMKIRHSCVMSVLAMALTALSGAAHAGGGWGGGGGGPVCSNGTLKGAFAFNGHGEILGLLDTGGALHLFTTPAILDDVALVTFDGNGGFKRTDYGNIGGLPKGGSTDFNPNQSGTYTVNPDCTGSMHVAYTSGVQTDLRIVVADDGTLVKSVVYHAYTPASGPAADGTSCTMGCAQGVQEYFEGKKVLVYGFR